jgi:ribonuclease Z
MKFLKYFLAFICLSVLLIFILLRIPSFQDRLFDRVITLPSNNLPKEDALSAVVCGSRSPLPGPGAQACILVKAGNDIYVVDMGDGSAANIRKWSIPYNQVRAVLFTHLHSDHISDLADFHLGSWIAQNRGSKLNVYGPKGVDLVTEGFEKAYQLDYQYRYEHHGKAIAPIAVAGFNPVTIDADQSIVLKKDGLTITVFEVSHNPIKPAFGYRFDYKDRSIVISGDTSYDENLIKKSQDADVLFHDALSINIIERMQIFMEEIGRDSTLKILEDVKEYHATTLEAAKAANEANVTHLVLYHLVPAPNTFISKNMFTRGMNDVRKEWTLSEDGTMVILPLNSKDIIISSIN